MGERHLCAPDRLPGAGRGRQGRDDRARHVRREPAGRPGRLASSSRRPRSSTTTSSGGSARRCPSGAGSASSTAPTTRRCVALRVHPGWIDAQQLPPGPRGKAFWKGRFDDINAFERHLDRNGTKVVKFFLHVSKEEQRRRFLARLDTPGRSGSSRPPISPSGPTGTSTCRPSRTRSRRPRPHGRPGT